jgi:hypothetical protein
MTPTTEYHGGRGETALRPELDDEELRLREGRRVSLFEAALWTTAIAFSMATPYWFGLTSLLIFFYGTLGALTWRLSKAMPVSLAVILAAIVAVIITSIMVAVIEHGN